MSAADASAYVDRLLGDLLASYDGPASLQLHTSPPRPAADPDEWPYIHPMVPRLLASKEGDLIEVTQPDGTRELYRLTSAEPDGFGVKFQMEPVPPEGSSKG